MKPLLLLLLVLFIGSCNNVPTEQNDRKDGFTPVLKTKEDSLYHDVMQGHDIGMAKINKVRMSLTQIKNELDSIKKLPSKKGNQSYQQALLKLQEDLNYADHAMYTWMEEFKVDSASGDKMNRIAYLESEKIKVGKVRDHILTGLQRADSLLVRRKAER